MTRPSDPWTALHIAALTGNLDIVKLLLMHGASKRLRAGTENKTPRDVAVTNGHSAVANLLE